MHTLIHQYLPENLPWYALSIFNRGVQYFFVASGFFLGQKIIRSDDPKKAVKEYCRRLLKPYIFFTAVWVVQRILTLIVKGLSMKEIIIEILQSFIAYPLNSVWYLQASLVAALLLLPFLIKRKINLALIIGLPLYAWGLLCHNYRFLVESTSINSWIESYLGMFITARNGLFYGFIFIALGIKCAELNYQKKVDNKYRIGILSLILYIITICEMLFIHMRTDVDDLLISTIVFIPALFMFTTSIFKTSDIKKERRALLARNISTGLYLLHRPILWFFTIISCPNFLKFMITIALGAGTCLISYRSKNKFVNGLLR